MLYSGWKGSYGVVEESEVVGGNWMGHTGVRVGCRVQRGVKGIIERLDGGMGLDGDAEEIRQQG